MTQNPADLSTLEQHIAQCALRERAELRRKLQTLQRRLDNNQPIDRGLPALQQEIAAALLRQHERLRKKPQPEYPAELPVAERRAEILKAIQDHQVVIVCGETGSGKTTQLPKICLEAGRGVAGMIGHTQPRRIAARSLSARIAEELKGQVGGTVGFKVRFTDQVGPDTYIKVMTDGILLAETQHDPQLLAYDTLIIDEAHERSLNIDFLLGYLSRLLPRRPELKVIITSATIDPQRFSRHFGDAPVIEVSGRTYPVEIRYRPLHGDSEDAKDIDRKQSLLDAIDELVACGPGDILIFLSGERDIREAADWLRKRQLPNTEIMPLYGRLSAAQQARVFQAHGGRRIVLATNVAETSITVPGVRYVIDSGLARISRYSYRTKVQRLPIEPVSQASANQRAGRCGRVGPGVCIRLYSEEDYRQRPEFTEPEILRTGLASVILQMLSLKLGDIEDFPFIEPPDTRYIRDGFKLLHELGAVDEANRITDIGLKLARFPVDVRIARMLLQAHREKCLREVLIIAAALSIQDPRERPFEQQQAADEKHAAFGDKHSDFIAYLRLWNFYREQAGSSNSQLRKLCQSHFLSYVRMQEWRDVHRQLAGLAAEMDMMPDHAEVVLENIYPNIHRALLSGLLSNIAVKGDEHEYTGARDLKLYIFPGSYVFKNKPKWIVAAELVETAKRYARTVARIEPEWIEPLAAHLVKRSYSDPHWEAAHGRVMALEQVSLYGLILVAQRRMNYARVNPAHARELFIRGALVREESSPLEFFAHNRKARGEVLELEAKSRRQDVLVDEDVLYAFFDPLVPPDINDIDGFKAWYKKQPEAERRRFLLDKDRLMQHDAAGVTRNSFPDALNLNGLKIPLSYHFEPGHEDDGVTARIPLAALNQIEAAPFEWLIPGLLTEKITLLIKSLPKPLRRNFVPAPDFAKASAEALVTDSAAGTVPLLPALGAQLQRMNGTPIPAEAWQPGELPPHLRMNFHIVQDGRVIARGRDLEQLKAGVGKTATASFEGLPVERYERADVPDWDFGDLPEFVEIRHQGLKLRGYPALVAADGRIDLKVLDNPDKAAVAHRDGVLQLFCKLHAKSIRYLEKNLPDIDQLCLLYAPIGDTAGLKRDMAQRVVDSALFSKHETLRGQSVFRMEAEWADKQLAPIANRIAGQLAQILESWRSLQRRLQGDVPPQWLPALREIREQLSQLVYPGFVKATPQQQLDRLPRYLKAIIVRLEKLEQNPARDRQLAAEIAPFWENCKTLLEDTKRRDKPAFRRYRWLLEEFRVSLFAQALGTSEPVSAKRLQAAWEEIKD
ncbi:MAG TPA: ATP-dependent RNA helicase HrpA [Gammaproteobacteria bacterium]|nr:ATP-dependent RNA helicase HrpA [Gammaproteobacteria bacterium]